MKVLKRGDFRIVRNNSRPAKFCVEQKRKFLFWETWSRHQDFYGSEPIGTIWFPTSSFAEEHIEECIQASKYSEQVVG